MPSHFRWTEDVPLPSFLELQQAKRFYWFQRHMLATSTKLKEGCTLTSINVVSKVWSKFLFMQLPETNVRGHRKTKCAGQVNSSLVVNSSSRQHHGVVICPLGCVPPPLLRVIPKMAACRVPHNPLGETLPHGEGKIHLQERQNTSQTSNQQC